MQSNTKLTSPDFFQNIKITILTFGEIAVSNVKHFKQKNLRNDVLLNADIDPNIEQVIFLSNFHSTLLCCK